MAQRHFPDVSDSHVKMALDAVGSLAAVATSGKTSYPQTRFPYLHAGADTIHQQSPLSAAAAGRIAHFFETADSMLAST